MVAIVDERSRVVLIPRRCPTLGSSSQATLRATVANKPGTPRRPRISR